MEKDKDEKRLFDVPDEMDKGVSEEDFTKALDRMSDDDRQIFEDTGVIHIDRDMPAETQTMHVVHLTREHQKKRNRVFTVIIALLVSGVVISSLGLFLNRIMRNRKTAAKTEDGESLVTIDSDSFPDSSFRNYVLTRLDEDGDGALSQDERNNVLVMIVPEEIGITDLTGVDLFPHLQSLTLKKTGVKNLDLSGVKELSYLNVSDTGIEELNLEEQTSLLDVCADNTPSLKKVYLPSESNIRTFETDGSSIGCEKDSGGFVIGCSLK